MADKTEKKLIPAYLGFASFVNFINGLRETGIPLKIDRSVLPKVSGSQFSSTMAALRFLRLVDEDDKPTKMMQELVHAPDNSRKTLYMGMLKEAYSFLFEDADFHLDKATGNQVADKFRAQEVSGSTVSKSISFFLALAQAADVKVSSHVKPPRVPRGQSKRAIKQPRKEKQPDTEQHLQDEETDDLPPKAGYMKIIVPLHGIGDGAIFFPEGMSPRQRAYALKITKFLLDNYWLDDDTQDALDALEGKRP